MNGRRGQSLSTAGSVPSSAPNQFSTSGPLSHHPRSAPLLIVFFLPCLQNFRNSPSMMKPYHRHQRYKSTPKTTPPATYTFTRNTRRRKLDNGRLEVDVLHLGLILRFLAHHSNPSQFKACTKVSMSCPMPTRNRAKLLPKKGGSSTLNSLYLNLRKSPLP